MMLLGTPHAAQAATGVSVTKTTTTSVPPNATTTLTGLTVTAPAPTTILQVTLSTDRGTLAIATQVGLTLDYGNQWSGDRSIGFQGLAANVNAALTSATLTTGDDEGLTAQVSLTALQTQPSYVFSASNGHFYQYVASTGISWDNANTGAATHGFLGQTGYLATVPTATVNDLVANRIQYANNVWFGAESSDTFSAAIKRTWSWTGGPLSGQPISYCSNATSTCDFVNNTGLYSSWSTGEPNNYRYVSGGAAHTGEWVAVTNWKGTKGKWNDLPASNTGAAGYLVEYGDLAQGGNFQGVVTQSSSISIANAPTAPTNVTATRGNHSASVTFAVPASNGGSAITGYAVTTSPGNGVTTCQSSPCTITGLTNGDPYTFTVHATNTAGSSVESVASAAVTPATVPGVPTDVTAVAGKGSVTISFTPPVDDGGSPITQYWADSPGGGVNACPNPDSPCILTGLTNGQPYTFNLQAINDVGPSDRSAATATVTPSGVPDAPTNVSATRDNGSALVVFTAPADDGGRPISGYTVTSTPDGRTASCAASPCSVTGLTNGTAYTFTVHATNALGASPESGPSTAVTPLTAPGAPTNVTAVRHNLSAEVSFTAPANTGGAISSYTVTSTPDGHTATCPGSPCTVLGLTNGTSYTFTVHATNDVDSSPESDPSSAVTPATNPGTPTGVTALYGNGSVSVAFTAPVDDGGSPITGYTITSHPGDVHAICQSSPCLLEGLTNGTSYTFSVHATNGVGDSQESDASAAVTPHAPIPLAVTSTTTTSVHGNATTRLSGLTVTAEPSSTLLVTLSTDRGTLTLPDQTGLTLDYGNNWSGDASISFQGTTTDINAALALAQLDPGDTGGQTAHVWITALPAESGHIYSASNRHFYEYVPSLGVTWDQANAGAASRTFLGQTGYLATLPNAQINDLVSHRIQGANNAWFGATSTDTFDSPIARTWAWTGGPLAGQAMTYCTNVVGGCNFTPDSGRYSSWFGGEPNNYGVTYNDAEGQYNDHSGEWAAVTNWNGTVGAWNDLTPASPTSGYLVEYGDLPTGATHFDGVVTDTTAVAVVDVPSAPTNVNALRGNTTASVGFTAPADHGSPITGYTVTAHSGDADVVKECTQRPCLVTGLTNGTSYTFTVLATNDVGVGPESEPSAAVTPATVPDAPTGVSAVRHNLSAEVSFTAPTNDGGATVTSYTVTSSPGGKTATCNASPCTVEGLTNGTAYIFTVVATNAVGDSLPSAPSTAVTPATVPGAPTGVAAVRGDQSATVSFTAPGDDGASAITGYTITTVVNGSAVTMPCAQSPCVFSGLTNGVAYTFTVHATNDVGDSAESAPSDAVTPATHPGVPTGVAAQRGDKSATITFTAPDNGGSAITGYTVTSQPGGLEHHCPSPVTNPDLSTGRTGVGVSTDVVGSPCVIDGLTNGKEYTFTVRASNGVGDSDESLASNPVTPAAVPDAPTGVSAVLGNHSATVSFTAPDGNGSMITGYTVTSSPADGVSAPCTASPCTVTGLTNGTAYTFIVHATNGVGDGPDSAASDPVTPATAPGAPTGVSAVRGDTSAVVSFSAPTDNGGSPVSSYTVTSHPGGATTSCAMANPCTVSGLTNGKSYTFTVQATNGVGTSVVSAPSVAVVPAAKPGVPTQVEAVRGDTEASVSFTPPADNGSTITGYTVTSIPTGGVSATCTSSPCLVTGLTNGTSYTFTVHATNDVGSSDESDPSKAVVPAGKPGTPTGVLATAAPGLAVVSFTAPDANGSPITGYTVTSSPGGLTATCVASPCTVTGLTNGTAYTFTVHATNAVDDSAESAPSPAVTPLGVPGAPSGLTAVRHNLSAEVSFIAPADDGGTTITAYTVTSIPGNKTATCLASPCTVQGLTNGTAYTFTVYATNAVGDSLESAPSTAVTPATVPDAPTGVSALRGSGSGSATISFTAPNNHGSAIIGYIVTSSPAGGISATCVASPCTVTGLTNGTPYTFTVHATNDVGPSAESAATNPVTPATVPTAPTQVSATGGNTTAVVTWTASAGNGGSAITGYTVTSQPGGVQHACLSGSPCTVTGLTNGTAYTFTVHATNDVGSSAESAPSSTVTPMTKPATPTDVAATRGDKSAVVTFTVPANGGSAITGYTVTTHPGSNQQSCPGTPCTITGLTNGTAYTFTVHATNMVGDSVESAPSEAVVPATTPSAPTAVSATRGDRAAVVTFTAPANNGGSAITGYTVTTQPGTGAHACVASPCTVTGLTNGTAYTFRVQATNALGDSAESDPSAAVTPATTPGRPIHVVATPGDGSASIAFTAPSTGGLAITSYTATSVPDGLTGTCQASPCVVEGLTNGTSYTFTVYATNDVGPSLDSAPSVPVTPVTVPGEPLDLNVTRGPNSATFAFTAPDTDGGATITKYQVSTDGGDTWLTLPTSGTNPITGTLRGLTNGTAYHFQVRAVNIAGGGPAAIASPVTPAARPDAPTGVTGTVGDHQVTVGWTTPNNNGAPITGYTVTTFPGSTTKSCTSSPCVITGLDNGTAYRFSVVATNDVGDSLPSARSVAVTPATTPGAATLLSVTSLAGAVGVTFTGPTTTGGSPVTAYQISTDGGTTWKPLTVTGSTPLQGLLAGLTNGTTYSVKVRAVNAVGGGAASASLSVKPATTPSAPRTVTATASLTKVTVTWAAPTSTGGSPITGYVVTASPGRQTCTTTTTSCVFPALPIGTYTFSVAAINTAAHLTGTGTGPAATSGAIRVTTRPGVPRALTVTPGDRALGLAFQPPASNGGSPITGYFYTVDGAKTWHRLTTTGTTTLKATVAPVLNGASYTVAVRAANANGAGPATATLTVRTAAWFADPLTPTQRKQEIAVPKDPTKYRGPLRNTTAAHRSHNGTIAYPAAGLRGRQLQPGQAVNVLFGFDSSTLTTAGKAQIKGVATSLRYVTAVTCEGYADYDGSASHELALSKSRATSVCAALHTYAPQLSSRTTVAYGSTYPVIVGGTPSQRGGNRRVVILIQR